MKMKRELRKKLLALGLLLLSLFLLAGLFLWVEAYYRQRSERAGALSGSQEPADEEILYFQGESYRPKDKLSTFLVIGVDTLGEAAGSGSYNNGGQADFLLLAIFDHREESYSLLHLNRDTMTAMDVLGVTGEKAGTVTAQLALSHTYGDGMEESCQNTVRAVSSLLYGIHVEKYLSMTMDGVVCLNDYIGGVPITMTEDCTAVDPRLTAGATVTFDGELALQFIRARSSMPDSSNLARMERQKLYLEALYNKLYRSGAEGVDEQQLAGAYSAAAPYLVTDATLSELSRLADWAARYTYAGLLSPEGEAVQGEEYIEFYPDEEKLRELVVELFYTRAS